MSIAESLTTKEMALSIMFAALYALFGYIRLSPIVGLQGYSITAAAMMAPVMGILLGPYIGALSTFTGGLIGLSMGSLSSLSFASGIASSLCSGLIHRGKRALAILVYASLFLALGIYPSIGPAWLFPWYMWFQIIGLLILISPLQTVGVRNFSENGRRLLYAFFVTSLVSAMAGQIAGTLIFEILQIYGTNYLEMWMATTFQYPVERIIIALGSALMGTALCKILRTMNHPFTFARRDPSAEHP